jgi:integrase
LGRLKEERETNNPLVFCDDNGLTYSRHMKPNEYSQFIYAWHKAVKQSGLKDFRFHDLRHTFMTWDREKGADLIILKELARHKTIDMVLRYAHVGETSKKNAVERLCSKQTGTIGHTKKNGHKMVTNAEKKSIIINPDIVNMHVNSSNMRP